MNGSWRRSRPFWGGLLVLIAGLELLSIPFATKALPLVIQSGTVGATYLIALVLVILGLMIWLQPGQRAFLGVVAVLVSIASFVYANLGGFLVGMLLGLVGGALAVAWAPEETAPHASGTPAEPSGAAAPAGLSGAAALAEPSGAPAPGGGEMTFTTRRVVSRDEHLRPAGAQAGPRTQPQPPVAQDDTQTGARDDTQTGAPAEARTPPRPPVAPPTGDGHQVLVGRIRPTPPPEDAGSRGGPDDDSDEGGDGGVRAGSPDDGPRPPAGPPGRYEGGPGAAGRALAIAMLPVLLVTGTGVPQEDPGVSAQRGTVTRAAPAAARSAVADTRSHAVSNAAVRTMPAVGSRAVSHAVPYAVSTLLPGAVPSAVSGVVPDLVPTIVPTDLPGALGSANPLAPLTGGRSRSSGASLSPGEDEGGQAPPAGPTDGQVRVAVEPAAVRAPSLTMTGMKFTGVVEMPTATGTVKMLRFTMHKAVLERPQQTMGSTTLVGSAFTFEGNVVICTTEMTAKLLGVPQRFTAEHPNILVRALKLVPSLNVPLTMTDVVSEQPYVTADSLRADDLHLVVGA
ncbi:hypothetical protein F5972_01820 [Microbispora cellulosiformans]|uniref:Uncharacterized protein n=1 Tax=Microbispora cellulosiformans TaxID=2614688 RepID=A0A5J5KA91_9ACTN|nr:DUF6114 domain-containing protein [Microbispora cellulosiformans]KAA9381595.1 hypothetical protein F5972_01820 [Microbispora cellulosiformans]